MTPLAQRPAMQMKTVNETFTVMSVTAPGADWLKEAARAKRQLENFDYPFNPNNPWLKNTYLTDLTDFRFGFRFRQESPPDLANPPTSMPKASRRLCQWSAKPG